MFKQATVVAAVLAMAGSISSAQPYKPPQPSETAQTMITGRSQVKSVYEASYTGPMRTTLTRENKYPGIGGGDVSAFFEHTEISDLEQDKFGISARYGAWENVTLGASVPAVNSDFEGDTNTGLGDVVLSLDLLAYQDIFRYPFIIPHVDVSFPTGDEDKGLGAGETVINFGISLGTRVYDSLTYIVDFSYAFNGSGYFIPGDAENIYMISGSLVWDISDRLAFLVEGRVYEELDVMVDMPMEFRGGLSYRIGRNLQITGYGGKVDGGFGDDYDTAGAKLTLGF